MILLFYVEWREIKSVVGIKVNENVSTVASVRTVHVLKLTISSSFKEGLLMEVSSTIHLLFLSRVLDSLCMTSRLSVGHICQMSFS